MDDTKITVTGRLMWLHNCICLEDDLSERRTFVTHDGHGFPVMPPVYAGSIYSLTFSGHTVMYGPSPYNFYTDNLYIVNPKNIDVECLNRKLDSSIPESRPSPRLPPRLPPRLQPHLISLPRFLAHDSVFSDQRNDYSILRDALYSEDN